jgi:excisionase family DNA binding protein
MQIGGDELLTLQEASERVGVSVSTLREQAQKGVLKASLRGRVWLVLASELDRYVNEHKGKPGRKPKPKGDT